MKQMLIYRPR